MVSHLKRLEKDGISKERMTDVSSFIKSGC